MLLHFHKLGYSAVTIAFLFLFYEFFGIVTNLLGGWIASRSGLKVTLYGGLALQIVALVMLALLQPQWPELASVAYVMAAQALSGIAKDLTKMSAKSAIKLVVPEGAEGALFKWVARLTGSKNALKGVGFFSAGFFSPVSALSALLASWRAGSAGAARHRHLACERISAGPKESQIHGAVLEIARDQLAFGRAAVPVRCARRLVRGRFAGLSVGAWMGVLAGRRFPRALVHRLRLHPGRRSGHPAPVRTGKSVDGSRPVVALSFLSAPRGPRARAQDGR